VDQNINVLPIKSYRNIIRYEKGAFKSLKKNLFAFFSSEKKRIQWPKKKKIIFPPPLSAILLPKSLDLKKNLYVP
jgi:hypothetical protein